MKSTEREPQSFYFKPTFEWQQKSRTAQAKHSYKSLHRGQKEELMKCQLHVRYFIDFKVRNTFIVPTDSKFQHTTSTGNNYLQAYRIQFMRPLKGYCESPEKEIITEVVCANSVI